MSNGYKTELKGTAGYASAEHSGPYESVSEKKYQIKSIYGNMVWSLGFSFARARGEMKE